MSTRTRISAAVYSVLLFAGGSALAADRGPYIGLSVGATNSSFDTGATVAAGAGRLPAGTAISTDSWAFSWKEVLGYQFNKNFAVELGYTSLGKFDLTRTATGAAPATGKVTIGGFGFAVVGLVPVRNDVSLFGKLGAFHSNIAASTTQVLFHSGAAGSDSESKTVPNFGFGVNYDLNSTFGVRAEIERFQGMGSSARTMKTDANLFSLGLSYKF